MDIDNKYQFIEYVKQETFSILPILDWGYRWGMIKIGWGKWAIIITSKYIKLWSKYK